MSRLTAFQRRNRKIRAAALAAAADLEYALRLRVRLLEKRLFVASVELKCLGLPREFSGVTDMTDGRDAPLSFHRPFRWEDLVEERVVGEDGRTIIWRLNPKAVSEMKSAA